MDTADAVEITSERMVRSERLKSARKAANLTQPRLARLVGCDSQTISRIERGETGPMQPTLRQAIERTLGMPADTLLLDSERPKLGGPSKVSASSNAGGPLADYPNLRAFILTPEFQAGRPRAKAKLLSAHRDKGDLSSPKEWERILNMYNDLDAEGLLETRGGIPLEPEATEPLRLIATRKAKTKKDAGPTPMPPRSKSRPLARERRGGGERGDRGR